MNWKYQLRRTRCVPHDEGHHVQPAANGFVSFRGCRCRAVSSRTDGDQEYLNEVDQHRRHEVTGFALNALAARWQVYLKSTKYKKARYLYHTIVFRANH